MKNRSAVVPPVIERLLDQLDRAYRRKAWHGPSLLECLAGLTAKQAAARPFKGAHSIWELVEHVATWDEVVALRLQGKSPAVPPEYNFPPVTKTTPAAWKATGARLARCHARLRRTVATFPAAKVGRRRPGTSMTWYVLIHGAIQHELYHAGQIALLRRSLGNPV
jgi:uncharacterized damage-inducible protein DinB